MEITIVITEEKSKADKFEAVAVKHINSIYRFALYMAENDSDARDLVQDTYLRAYRFFEQFEEGTNCKAWLLKILKNTFINNIRRDKRYPRIIHLAEMKDQDIELAVNTEPEDWISGQLFDDEVAAAIEALPDVYRTIVLLTDVEGLSYKEVAELVGCPIGTVMSRLCRGRRLLRKKLHNYAIQYGYIASEIEV